MFPKVCTCLHMCVWSLYVEARAGGLSLFVLESPTLQISRPHRPLPLPSRCQPRAAAIRYSVNAPSPPPHTLPLPPASPHPSPALPPPSPGACPGRQQSVIQRMCAAQPGREAQEGGRHPVPQVGDCCTGGGFSIPSQRACSPLHDPPSLAHSPPLSLAHSTGVPVCSVNATCLLRERDW